MTETCCAVARALRARIDDLEIRNEQLMQMVELRSAAKPPLEWALGRQEAVVTQLLARGPVTRGEILAAHEADQPTPNGRVESHVSVVLYRLRQKLADFGWCITYSRAGVYQILREQQTAFTEAMNGGPIAYPAISARGAAE